MRSAYSDVEISKQDILSQVGAGWATLVGDLFDAAEAYNADHPAAEPASEDAGGAIRIAQVKEKFGGLRFYIYGGDRPFQELILRAEQASFTVCEYCGAPGEPRTRRWIKTLCDSCDALP